MSRTQSFDRDDVVRAARDVFWRGGYDATSVPELEQATGLSRSSIYNTFGSKRGLFDAAVQSYLDDVIRPRLARLQGDEVAPDAVLAYLTGLQSAFQRADSMAATNGCLLINAAGSPIAHDHEVARTIAGYRDELHTALSRGIAAHAPTLSATAQADLAAAVTGLVVSAFALARIDPAQAAENLGIAVSVVANLR